MSHYFSRVRLVDWPQDMALLAMLSRHGSAYRDHALIWRLFSDRAVERDFIFRHEHRPGGQGMYYVVSQREPQLDPDLFEVQTKVYEPRLAIGEWVRFDLRANPTVARRSPTDKNSKRHDVLMEAKIKCADLPQAQHVDFIKNAAIEWITTRAERWGLMLDPEHVSIDGYTQHKLRHKQRNIEFSSLDYRGVAQVQDDGLLLRALFDGVGHARAFGCGLMLVRRLE